MEIVVGAVRNEQYEKELEFFFKAYMEGIVCQRRINRKQLAFESTKGIDYL